MSVMVPPVAVMPYVDLHRGADGPRLGHVVTDSRAWTRDTVTARDWTVPLDPAALAEIRELAVSLARDPLPTLLLTPDQFRFDAGRAVMARVKSLLTDGIGVALVDRLPLDELGVDQAVAAYWVLSQCLGTLVAQNIARGQIQLLNNREFGHYRSTFEDEPGTPRHLVRLWMRERGRRSYDG